MWVLTGTELCDKITNVCSKRYHSKLPLQVVLQPQLFLTQRQKGTNKSSEQRFKRQPLSPNNLHEILTSVHAVQVTNFKDVNMKRMFFFRVHNKSWGVILLYPVFPGSRCQITAAWHMPCSATSMPQVLSATLPVPRQKFSHFNWVLSTNCLCIHQPSLLGKSGFQHL